MRSDSFYEREIKAKVLNELARQRLITRTASIASEYAIGRMGRRVDLALWGSQFVGIEIKSERDSLTRLEGQISVYRQIFDRTIAVVAEKHLAKTIKLLNGKCDIWCIDSAGVLSDVARSELVITKRNLALTALLSLEQLRECVPDTGHIRGSRASLRAQAEMLPPSELLAYVQGVFVKTFTHSTSAFWSLVGRGKVKSEHVEALSRFATVRKQLVATKLENERFWNDWRSAASTAFRIPEGLTNQPTRSLRLAHQDCQADGGYECLSGQQWRAASK